MPPAPRLQLLGAPQWQRSDGALLALLPQRRFQLLALLGCEADWVPRARLAALFWPGRDAAAARGNLRKLLHELRQLGLEAIEDSAAGLRWLPRGDLQDFRAAWQAGDWALAAERGAGSLMPGLDDAPCSQAWLDWLNERRTEHAARWRECVLEVLASADAAQAWRWAEALLQADALDEAALAAALNAAHALARPELAESTWRRYTAQLAAQGVNTAPAALRALAEGSVSACATLRPPLSPLVGRHAEMQQLAERLRQGRLVTLLGPGGVGKTRLARHAALALAPHYAQGAVFVALDDLSTPAALPGRVGAALGLSLAPGADAGLALAAALATRSLLLVLDGFEAVIDAADSVGNWLAQAAGLHVLVTSRERLELEGEWLLTLAGLPGNDAVQLFAERARAVQPRFELAVSASEVTEICRRVEGLPLALELAAAWTRVLPAAEIARELAVSMALLSDGPERNLRAVFDRSWQLLTQLERQALAQLAVFRGGFTREAARAVAEVPLPLLASLVDKSMLRSDGQTRFDMHRVLLAFADEKLAALPQCQAVAERHSRWYLAAANGAIDAENMLAAWRHAVERADEAAIDATLSTLPWIAAVEGRIDEAAALLGAAADRLQGSTATAAYLRAHQAWMLLWMERYGQANQIAEEALRQLDQAGHSRGAVMALRTLGHAARRGGRHALAAQRLTQALQRAESSGLADLIPTLLDALAMALNMLGRFDEARALVQAAMRLNQASGDALQCMYNEFNLSQSHSLAGDAAAALPWCEAALASARSSRHGIFVPYAGIECALVLATLDRLDAAQAHLDQAFADARTSGDRAALASAHEARARICLARGEPGGARDSVASAAALCRATGNVAMGASLIPVAAQAFGASARTLRWLASLLALSIDQEPVRREARAVLRSWSATPAQAGAMPVPLDAVLGEIAGRNAAETPHLLSWFRRPLSRAP